LERFEKAPVNRDLLTEVERRFLVDIPEKMNFVPDVSYHTEMK
jgi:hypothetical protein